jgi:hypothetical protein
MKPVVLLALLGITISGTVAAQKVDVDKDRDEMTGVTSWTTWLDGKGYFGTPAPIRLGVRKIVSEENPEPGYVLVVHYRARAPEWAFIERGQSCLWLIDGERIALSGEGSRQHREVYNDGSQPMVEEYAYYPVDQDFLSKLGAAREARIRIVGSRRQPEKKLKDKHFEKVRGFVTAVASTQ